MHLHINCRDFCCFERIQLSRNIKQFVIRLVSGWPPIGGQVVAGSFNHSCPTFVLIPVSHPNFVSNPRHSQWRNARQRTTRGAEEANLNFSEIYRFEAPPLYLVVQSAVRDLSACHAIVLRVWCNFRVISRRATLRKHSHN